MHRFARGVVSGLLVAVAGLQVGCSGASGLLTGSTPAAADAPGSAADTDPLARPISVAWTSARAQRCGFFFDPAKLRSSYLAYEARQSGPEQLTKAEKTYDTTLKTIRERVAADREYCSDAKSAEIKKDLTRHLAGDFTPNLPKAKKEETCGFLGMGCASSEAWSPEKFWAEQEKKNNMSR